VLYVLYDRPTALHVAWQRDRVTLNDNVSQSVHFIAAT